MEPRMGIRSWRGKKRTTKFGVTGQGSVSRRGLWWSRWWRTRTQDSYGEQEGFPEGLCPE